MLATVCTSALAFQGPSMPASSIASSSLASSSIVMKAAIAAPAFADPIANHGSELSLKDIPFDPLNLASEDNLEQYREAEIKHGRLAMLAALGWPAAEFFEPLISKSFGLTDELVETAGRAPSLLNGGLEEAQIPYFVLGAFAIAGFADYKGTEVQKELKLEPGNVSFDPLTLYPTDAAEQEKYKVAELKHGRIAMLAITVYALEEAISGTSILQETVPLFGEIERLALEGPIQGNIDLYKDLVADGQALLADSAKQEQIYGDAFTKPLFSRPDVRTVNFGDVLLGSLPFLFAAGVANRK